jgi:hypothetical protein
MEFESDRAKVRYFTKLHVYHLCISFLEHNNVHAMQHYMCGICKISPL